MKLSVKERLVLLNSLGSFQGDALSVKLMSDLQDKLGMSEEDYKTYGFQDLPDGGVVWDVNAPQDKEIEIGEKSTELIAKHLKKLGRQEQLTIDHASLLGKFVVEDDED